jgi:hypothetical protein
MLLDLPAFFGPIPLLQPRIFASIMSLSHGMPGHLSGNRGPPMPADPEAFRRAQVTGPHPSEVDNYAPTQLPDRSSATVLRDGATAARARSLLASLAVQGLERGHALVIRRASQDLRQY